MLLVAPVVAITLTVEPLIVHAVIVTLPVVSVPAAANITAVPD